MALAVFVTAVLALRYVVFPQIDDYRLDIAASVSRATGLAVTLADVDAAWQGLLPRLTLTDVRIADRLGKPVLDLARVEITLSWWTLFAGDLRFRDVEFDRPTLRLRRGKDGLVYLADKAIGGATPEDDGAFAQWLLAQPRLFIRDATLAWHDELSDAPEVEFTHVDLAVRKSGSRHRLALVAVPPASLAGRLDLRADVALTRAQGEIRAAGTFYAQSPHADVARLRRYLPLPETLRSASGAFRVWLDFEPGRLTDVTADVNLRGVRAQLDADALPLELESLAGRAFYRARADGFEAGTRDLRFRTASGLAAESGEYAITSRREPGKPAQGEVRANGIDLKIAATLLDYLPVPREVKAQVIRFAPRGRLVDSSYLWTGEDAARPATFRIKSRFENLAVNAVDAIPGATGLSGTVEGDEQGGNLSLDSKGATFEALGIFRDALALDELQARASWKRTAEGLVVAIREARLANADAELNVRGTWRELPAAQPPSPGRVDLEGVVVRARAAGVANYLPNGIAGTREYLDRAILAGEVRRARYELKGDLWHFPFRDGKQGHFLVEGEIADGRLQYHPAWPAIGAIRGGIRFENAGMEIRADEATIFDSHVRRTKAVIADFGAEPPLLVVDGEVDTSGGDGTRFLRESPLASGPGAFTKVVGVEGPARLKLHLGYPLRGTEGVRVNGEYVFAGGSANVGRSLLLTGIRGTLGFTERAVRSSEITGSMFGQPAVLRLATQPDNTVLTQLEGRMSAPVLGAFIPEAFARRMAGAADWKARVVSGAEGTELRVESALKGLVIGLPEPFGKTADEGAPWRSRSGAWAPPTRRPSPRSRGACTRASGATRPAAPSAGAPRFASARPSRPSPFARGCGSTATWRASTWTPGGRRSRPRPARRRRRARRRSSFAAWTCASGGCTTPGATSRRCRRAYNRRRASGAARWRARPSPARSPSTRPGAGGSSRACSASPWRPARAGRAAPSPPPRARTRTCPSSTSWPSASTSAATTSGGSSSRRGPSARAGASTAWTSRTSTRASPRAATGAGPARARSPGWT